MNQEHYFNPSRFISQLKVDWFKSRKVILLTIFIIIDLFIAGFCIEPFFVRGNIPDDNPGTYVSALLLGGFIISSMAFTDLRSTLRKYHFLTLPSSVLEKFMSTWLITSVGWVILFTTSMVVFNLVTNAIGSFIFPHMSYYTFNPFGSTALNGIRYYLVLQSVFLVGATQFKRYVFPKTVLTLLLFAIFGGIITCFIMAETMKSSIECASDYVSFQEMTVFPLFICFKWLFWFALAPLCWTVTYLGLKEKEA